MEDDQDLLKQILTELAGKADQSRMEERFDRQDERFARQDERFDRQDERFARQDERSERQEGTIADMFEAMKEGFQRVEEGFQRMEDRQKRVEARQLAQDMKMEEWRCDCRVFTEGWKENRQRLDKVEKRVDDLESKSA